MPTHYRDPVVRCDGCGATTTRSTTPDGKRQQYEAGWRARVNPGERPLRFLPHTALWSCPDCPSVALGGC